MPAKLNDIQLALLTAAAQRDDGSLFPPPDSLIDQGARIRKAIPSLIKRALVEEVDATDEARAWREDGDARFGVVITTAGRAAIVVDTDENTSSTDEPASQKPKSKIATVIDMLSRDDGATLGEMVAATGWLPHTTRAALTGLRKKGHAIGKKDRDGGTAYTIPAA